ncbi:MMPL family transporter [Occultella gossypii]|uniref:MMPL family transporter n=1 Tax=Occultella gossypii TaxID=2800820 RepID=A0ABS7SFA1_9MICO|nr:MMPL family transporter [Occultella gossypii]MBZ2198907.1 MMPL family transporter [Occultella gossypii]
MAELLYRLGRFAARRARTVIAVWLAILVIAGGAFAVAGGTLATSISIPGTPTTTVTDRLADEFPEASGGTGTVVLQTEDGSPFTAEQLVQIEELLAEASAVDGVTTVIDPFVTEEQRAAQQAEIEGGLAQLELAAAQGETPELAAQRAGLEMGAALLEMAAETRQVASDGATALATIAFEDPQLSIPQETKDAVVEVFDESIDGVTIDLSSDITQGIPELFGVGEVLGLLVAAIVLIVMLGTLIGAGLPILTALIGVGIGALASLSLSGVVEMVSVTPVLGLMLGLAVGIDYSLFIINRHRRQLKHGEDLHSSIGLANGTSGNAVVFAGATVLIALLALNITGIPFLGLMGTVGAFCILVAVLIAITLTPALLGLVGTRILSRKERAALAAGTENGTTPAAPAAPQPMSTARAIGRVVIGIAALVIIALPALDLRLNLPDGSTESADSTQYRAYTTIAEEFGEGRNGTLLVVADLPEGAGEQDALLAQVEIGQALFAQEDVVAVAPIGTSEDFSVIAFQVVPAEGPTSESTETLVHTLRDASPIEGVYEIGVAGSASGNIDISEKLADALPIYLAVVVGLSLLILILVFRSVFVPVIATLGFILSYFAALGGVVAIYQWGWLAPVFGVDSPGPILNFLPTILVGILFGLAMDYMLFLGTGMREAYAHGAPARVAVVQGVRAGRTVVTAAAIIMISVFGGFVFSHSAMIRPIGFALAFGVLVDAFVVRMLIIPALMHLAGDKAWWLPRWLDRILPDVDVEGAKLERRHGHDAEVADSSAGDEAGDGDTDAAREAAPVSG